jgi:hypothetical protein
MTLLQERALIEADRRIVALEAAQAVHLARIDDLQTRLEALEKSLKLHFTAHIRPREAR